MKSSSSIRRGRRGGCSIFAASNGTRAALIYETNRPVLTASNWQIRQPIYKSSIGRWRHYAEFLPPLFASLGLKPPQREPAASHESGGRAKAIAASAS